MLSGLKKMKQKIAIFSLWVFCALCFFAPFAVFKDWLFPFVTSKALVLRFCVAFGLPFFIYLALVKKSLRPNLKNPMNILVLGFLVLNFISAIFGVNPVRSFWGNFERMGGVVYLLTLALLYFYLQTLAKADGRYLERFLKLGVFCAFILSAYGMLVAFGMKPFLPDPSLPRISITFGNPIYVGSFLILPMFLSVFFAFRAEKIWTKIAYWFFAFVQFLAIYQSGTRGAAVGIILALFLAGIAFVVLSKNRNVKIYGASIILLFSAIFGTLYLKSSSLPNTSIVFRVFKLKDSNTEARLIQWKTALRGVKDFPLLGVGPENYYLIANKYHNPEMFKYDRSWFDKPHNFLLEILVTTGIFGFIAYGGIVLLTLYFFWYAYRRDLLSLPELLALSGGAIAYQIQNLFVFDNVSASLTFFVYLVFAVYLYSSAVLDSSSSSKTKKPQVYRELPEVFAQVSAVVALIGSAWFFYLGVYLPAQAAYNVNYGYAYINADYKISEQYFRTALDLPFNFDYGESALKYSDLPLALASSQQAMQKDPASVERNLKNAIESLSRGALEPGNYPIYWQRLANLYLVDSYIHKKPFPQEGEEALAKAILLAPNRNDARMLMVQTRWALGRFSDALNVIDEVLSRNPDYPEAILQKAMILKDAGKPEEAKKLAESITTSDPQLKVQIEGFLKSFK